MLYRRAKWLSELACVRECACKWQAVNILFWLCGFCRKMDKDVIASSLRLCWRTTTPPWGMPGMRDGTWPSPVEDGHEKARGHGSTNVRSILWRDYQGVSSLHIPATTDHLTLFTTPSTKGLNVRSSHLSAEEQKLKKVVRQKRNKQTGSFISGRFSALFCAS